MIIDVCKVSSHMINHKICFIILIFFLDNVLIYFIHCPKALNCITAQNIVIFIILFSK
jgi:hypothetical protein